MHHLLLLTFAQPTIMFDGLMKHPYNRYLKSDADIVYVHPNAFRLMVERKNSCECFMHFANIVTNW